MNGIDSKYTDPGAFVDSLMAEFGLLADEARHKAELEQTLDIDVPVIGSDDVDYGSIEDAEESLRDFAMYSLYADLGALQELINRIELAEIILNGYETPQGAPETDMGSLGVDATLTDIHMGLSTWRNATADTFRENFVTSIGQRKTNNVAAMGVSIFGLKAAQSIVIGSRKAALEMVADARTALSEYSPTVNGIMAGINLALTGAGFVAGPATGVAITVAQEVFFEDSDMTVAEMMRGFSTAVGKQKEEKDRVDGVIGGTLASETLERLIAWPSQVCSRPEPASTDPDC